MEYSEGENEIIERAFEEGGNVWDNRILEDLKRKIKDSCLKKQKNRCCYCRRSLHGEFSFVIDIEHVLPKGEACFKKYMFDPVNLAVSCKRCNMKYKRADISFLKIDKQDEQRYFISDSYKFIHPNLDDYFTHLKMFSMNCNDATLVTYRVVGNSEKGEYTYKYFNLRELEVDSLNEVQGVKNVKLEIEGVEPAIKIAEILQPL